MHRSFPIALEVAICVLLVLPVSASAEREYGVGDAAGTPPSFLLEADNITVQLSGRAQLQIGMLVGDDALLVAGDAAEEPGFRLRRARFATEAVYKKNTHIALELNLLSGQGSPVHEAHIGWENEWLLAYGGLVKMPVSRSALLSSRSLQHVERPISVRGIAPSQQLGMIVGGKVWDERVRLTAGFFNGMHRGDSFAEGWEQVGPEIGNRFGGFAVSTRLDFEPLGVLGSGPADLGHSRDPLLGVGGGFFFNAGETVRGTGFAADIAFKWMGASLLAEFLQLQTEPAEMPTTVSSALTKVTMRGVVAQVGYAPVRDWLDVAFRFEMVDENTELENEGDFITLGGTVSLFAFEGHLKVQLYYRHRMEMEGKELDNDTFLLQTEGRF